MNYSKYNSYLKHNKQAAALGFNPKQDIAPKILAKGSGIIAEEIIQKAEEEGIPIKKDKNLVQLLSALEIDTLIPVETYSAVAEILASIYKYNDEMNNTENDKISKVEQLSKFEKKYE